ncbi:MAG: FkbM family methyltransferase [Chloroflexi bacterium]|nr:FkbM family methyltransferase [Chloroflexota bacterium]
MKQKLILVFQSIQAPKFIPAIQALIATITKKILGLHAYALIVKSDNGLFAVDPEDYGVGMNLRMKGKWGLDEIERLKCYITLGSRVLIVGAHIGTFVIPISKLCKKVIAIEANPITYDLLLINIALNSVSNCKALNIAASDKNENIEFLLNRADSGGSKRVPKEKKLIYYYDNPKKISVKAFCLDSYLEEKDFDLIVMDIEGSEYFALKGMQEILSNSKVLVVEFLPHHLKNVSGITVEQFLSVIEPHFSKLTVPSKQQVIGHSQFRSYLIEMYNKGQEDPGIIFEKVQIGQ